MASLTETVTVSAECDHSDLDVQRSIRRQGSGFILRIESITCKCGAVMRFPAGNDRTTTTVAIPFLPTGEVAAVPAKSPAKEPPKKPEPPDPTKGLPGTEMLSLTEELGIEAKPGCGCKSMAATMDRLGVEGCRQRAPELLLTVQANYDAWGWKDKLHAATAAAWKAAGLGVNPLDPVKSLVELAIDRAELRVTCNAPTGPVYPRTGAE